MQLSRRRGVQWAMRDLLRNFRRPGFLLCAFLLLAVFWVARAQMPGGKTPWMVVHLQEIDADKDGEISKAEVLAVVNRTVDGYNAEGKITAADFPREREVHTAMAGFVVKHFADVDANRDGTVTREELTAAALDMWEKYVRGDASAPFPAPGGNPPPPDDPGRPVDLVAKDLGVTPEQFREAFKNVHPAPKGDRPTEAQRAENRKVLSEALGVSPEKLDAVMDKYRPEGPGKEWGVK